jgi:hypothetical protein
MSQSTAPSITANAQDRFSKLWSALSAGSPSSIRLGIWGTSEAGKTTYLAMLYDQLLRSPEWSVAADERASTFVEDQLHTLFNAGLFPPATEALNELDVLTYHVKARKPMPRGLAEVVISFVDAPGEFYEDPVGTGGRVNAGMDIIDYLASCHGIIFLLDPQRGGQRASADYQSMLMKLFMAFQRRTARPGGAMCHKLEQYLAFCVTKVDREPFWSRRDAPDKLAADVLGTRLVEMIETTFSDQERFKFFATSAIGRYQEPGGKGWTENVRLAQGPAATAPAQNVQGAQNVWIPTAPAAGDWMPQAAPAARLAAEPASIIRRDQIAPLGVVEPLSWLLSSIGKRRPNITRR